MTMSTTTSFVYVCDVIHVVTLYNTHVQTHAFIVGKAVVVVAAVIMCCNYMTLDAKQFVTNFTLRYKT